MREIFRGTRLAQPYSSMTAAMAAAISSMSIALSLPRLPLKCFTATEQVRVASAADGSVRLLLSLGLIGTIQMTPEKRSSHDTIGTTNLVVRHSKASELMTTASWDF